MKYRIMQIGDKYAANIVGTNDYVARDGKETWTIPVYVLQHCVVEDIDSAKKAGEHYITVVNKVANAQEIMDSAKELCPVCSGPIETKQYYDCCSAQCYKDKHV